ncbi:MAG: hypothetical protein ACP6IS_04830 [Candidatus Asgardarchaeia archaeon]
MESLKEREREKAKEKLKIRSTTKEKIKKIAETTTTQAIQKNKVEHFEDFFPSFREYAHMYFMPKNKELYESWLSEWSNFIVTWAMHHKKLIVSIDDIQKSVAFSYKEYRLSIKSIITIFEYLVKQKLAEWVDDKKERIRVFWLSDEALTEEIYKWAWKTGTLLLDVYKLINAEKYWSVLPPEYLEKLLFLLVRTGKAKWVSKEKRIIEIKLRGFK